MHAKIGKSCVKVRVNFNLISLSYSITAASLLISTSVAIFVDHTFEVIRFIEFIAYLSSLISSYYIMISSSFTGRQNSV
jgi:hypothetical protein